MDGTGGDTSCNGSSIEMIAEHLQIPTLLMITPLMVWGMWLISESIFESWGPWHHRITQYLKFEKSSQAKASRRLSILFNFAVGISLIVFGYFFLFMNPQGATLVICVLVITSTFLVYLNGVQQRREKVDALSFERELPTYMQLMTVLISSGVSPARSMDVLSRRSTSVSGRQLQSVVKEIKEGKSVVEALDSLSQKYDVLVLRRFVNVLILGIERGSSLTPILIAQVKDARTARKNQILQRAGKAEIALMIPVVFLILPISILFALWPSYQQLENFM
jgi:Flp pilus assembly protein TadB